MDVARVQRRTLALLCATQIVGGVGVAVGFAVGALLTASIAGTGASGFATSAWVVGAALLAVPASRLVRSYGRRPGMAFLYCVAALGTVIIVISAVTRTVPLLFVGMFLFGGGSAANHQARFVAADLAPPERRGRHLSTVVWATTIGAVAGPNLAPLADRVLRPFGTVEYSGPFAFSVLAFLLSAAAIWLLLRPDPLLVARTLGPEADLDEARVTGGAPPRAGDSAGLRAALRVVVANPAARLGVAAIAVGHLVMVGVMSMTPLHIDGYVSEHGDVLRVVGIVLSLHIAGMFGLAPVVGWLTDRLGRRPVILGGICTLLIACAVAGIAGHRTPLLSVGLALLGLGWSGTMVAGSTLLSESVPAPVRPAVQGLADLVMGLAGAAAGAVSGLVVDWAGYPTLTLIAAIATVPLAALALRPVPALVLSEGS